MGTASLAVNVFHPPAMPPPGFQDLYQQYSETVYRTALRVTGNTTDAEDVLQNVFLRILDHQLTLDPMWSPERYLKRAATNAAIDLLRKRSTKAETDLVESRDYGSSENTVFLKERLRSALARLAAVDAELFVMCYLEGYSYDELAEQYQLERGTVASRLFRIRAALQKELEK
jgi:RNA polymerase sigma-70 factor (ECF subfamily)